MHAKIEPLQDQVVIRREDLVSTTKGGLVLPDVSKEKPTTGFVVAVGEGRWISGPFFVKTRLHPGDKVLFGAYSGMEIELGGEKLLVMSEQDIIGRLEE